MKTMSILATLALSFVIVLAAEPPANARRVPATQPYAKPTLAPVTGNAIAVQPGTDLVGLVAHSAAGSTFLLKAGVHRVQQIKPLDNDQFTAEAGTILSGAVLLSGFSQQGPVWVLGGQPTQETTGGKCDSTHPMCNHSDDLFLDDAPLARMASPSGLASGQWYYDVPNGTVYMADNPAGHKVELSVTRSAFSGTATGVLVSGLIIEKFASPAQVGAVGDQYPSANWTIQNNEVRLNHGTGIQVGAGSQVLQNFVHHNGQKGIGGTGANVNIIGNEISYNNYAGFSAGWEAGATKFTRTNNLVVRNNNVHDNLGSGLWTDTDNINTLYDANTVVNNRDGGIQHEISFSAIIKNNTVKGNGTDPNWLWQSQILIQNSQGVEVYANTVVASSSNGNGIGIVNQSRGNSPIYGTAWVSVNNYVHNNSITYLSGSRANSGVVADYNQSQVLRSSVNRFDSNSYHVPKSSASIWNFNAGPIGFRSVQQLGQEIHGTIDNNIIP